MDFRMESYKQREAIGLSQGTTPLLGRAAFPSAPGLFLEAV